MVKPTKTIVPDNRVLRASSVAPALQRAFGMRFWVTLLPAAGYFLFLWTFFATEGFKYSIKVAESQGILTAELKEVALRFGTAWRHGMEGQWPIYMPGFFVLSVALVSWCRGRSLQLIFWETAFLLPLAAMVAIALGPLGSRILMDTFQHEFGLGTLPLMFKVSWSRIGTALLTIGCWILFVVTLVRASELRKPRLMLLPVMAFAGLHLVRFGEAGALTRTWAERVLLGDRIAILSLLMIPLVASALVWLIRCPKQDSF